MTPDNLAFARRNIYVLIAALGIQWRLLAMFAPSFVTGHLMARFGKERVTALGLLLIAVSAVFALAGLQLLHLYVSLILLGVGWNFGFIVATAIVTDCHTDAERGKAQGANDFLIFGTVAAASFFAGALLHISGWQAITWLIFSAVALILVPLVWRAPAPSLRRWRYNRCRKRIVQSLNIDCK